MHRSGTEKTRRGKAGAEDVEALERNGYAVLTAVDGTDALAPFEKWRGKVRVVLTDVSMPGMDGVVLIEALRNMGPGLSVISTSGRGSSGKSAEFGELEY